MSVDEEGGSFLCTNLYSPFGGHTVQFEGGIKMILITSGHEKSNCT